MVAEQHQIEAVRRATGGEGPEDSERRLSEAEVAELAQRAGRGDTDAFGKLYDIYLDRVYRFIFYRIGRAVEAEDLTEEIFLKAWEAIGSYRWQGVPFGAWLFRLARNHLIDYIRTRHEAVQLAEITPTGEPEPAEMVMRALDAAELRGQLMLLTEDQREVIVLKFLEGLSTKEIASVVGRQEGAVRALQMRALQALRKLIGGDEER